MPKSIIFRRKSHLGVGAALHHISFIHFIIIIIMMIIIIMITIIIITIIIIGGLVILVLSNKSIMFSTKTARQRHTHVIKTAEKRHKNGRKTRLILAAFHLPQSLLYLLPPTCIHNSDPESHWKCGAWSSINALICDINVWISIYWTEQVHPCPCWPHQRSQAWFALFSLEFQHNRAVFQHNRAVFQHNRAVFQWKIIILQGQFSNISAFFIERSKKKAYSVLFYRPQAQQGISPDLPHKVHHFCTKFISFCTKFIIFVQNSSCLYKVHHFLHTFHHFCTQFIIIFVQSSSFLYKIRHVCTKFIVFDTKFIRFNNESMMFNTWFVS